MSAEPIAEWYSRELRVKSENLKVIKINGLKGWEISENLTVLENLGFTKKEENDQEFSKNLLPCSNLCK